MPGSQQAVPSPPPPGWIRPSLVASLVLGFCLVLTWHMYRDSKQEAAQALQADFDFRAREIMNSLGQRVSGYLLVMRGVQGLFASSDGVSRTEFADYVMMHDMERDFRGMRGVAYSERVEPAALAAHTARIRAQGRPGYAVEPPGERPLYAPITYIEPFSGTNQRALGFDMLSEPVRRAAYEQSRDSGEPALSGKLVDCNI